MNPHWKVLLAGLAEHGSLIQSLSDEGHEVHATDTLSEACLYLTSNEYDLIIIDTDANPAEVTILSQWLADGASSAQVIQLTRWRIALGRNAFFNFHKAG